MQTSLNESVKHYFSCILSQEPDGAQQKKTPKALLKPEKRAELHGIQKVAGQKVTFGGYDCKFVEPPPSVFQTDCPICHLILRDPYQATCCGTNFCNSCSLRIQADSNPCPSCRECNFEAFEDKRLKRSLNQLHVLCTHSRYGCEWRGELGELENHLNEVVHSGELFR